MLVARRDLPRCSKLVVACYAFYFLVQKRSGFMTSRALRVDRLLGATAYVTVFGMAHFTVLKLESIDWENKRDSSQNLVRYSVCSF
jgi:hypothetical protein